MMDEAGTAALFRVRKLFIMASLPTMHSRRIPVNPFCARPARGGRGYGEGRGILRDSSEQFPLRAHALHGFDGLLSREPVGFGPGGLAVEPDDGGSFR